MLLTASSKTAGSDLLLNHMTELPHVAWNQTKHIHNNTHAHARAHTNTHTVRSANVTSAERGATLRAFKGGKGERSKGKWRERTRSKVKEQEVQEEKLRKTCFHDTSAFLVTQISPRHQSPPLTLMTAMLMQLLSASLFRGLCTGADKYLTIQYNDLFFLTPPPLSQPSNINHNS